MLKKASKFLLSFLFPLICNQLAFASTDLEAEINSEMGCADRLMLQIRINEVDNLKPGSNFKAGCMGLDSKLDWSDYHLHGDMYSYEKLRAQFKGGYFWSIATHYSVGEVGGGNVFERLDTQETRWFIELGILYQQEKIIEEKIGWNKIISKHLDHLDLLLKYFSNKFLWLYDEDVNHLGPKEIARKNSPALPILVKKNEDPKLSTARAQEERQKIEKVIELGRKIVKFYGRPVPVSPSAYSALHTVYQ